MKLLVKKLHDDATIPEYQTPGSAGFDIHALITFGRDKDSNCFNDTIGHGYDRQPIASILPGDSFLVKTGLSVAVPDGFEMQIRPRSGLALKKSITVANSPGTLDSDYRNEIGVILINHGTEPFLIQNGDRIAQGVINKVERVEFNEVDELDTTERKGGFGSTGR